MNTWLRSHLDILGSAVQNIISHLKGSPAVRLGFGGNREPVVKVVSGRCVGYIQSDRTDQMLARDDNSEVEVDSHGLHYDLQINLLSRRDGRAKLAQVARDLVVVAEKGEISAKDLSVGVIDKRAMCTNDFPDPQLVMVYSRDLVLYNYPPWFIRNAEL
ncbi:hypothetical protein EV182_000467 [Spiromyces aspiralis]|uniref:Uncharacterized protein n=1 Tax=Spiromyces aspiralis TaxID=68401 RepID=A0ACC1HXZ9_9FUNG|nr:hypothetical protein EV182_000467 [Spiromyces aspiralis]